MLFLAFPHDVHAISVRSSSSNSASSGTAVSVSAPAGTTAGDVVIVTIHLNDEDTSLDNNGATPFTEDLEYLGSGTGQSLIVYSRRIQPGDPSTYNFTASGSTRWSIIAVTYQDPNPSVIYDVAPSEDNLVEDSGTTVTAPSIVTTIDGSYHVAIGADDGSGNSVLSGPGGIYTLEESTTNQAQGYADAAISPAGSTGPQSFTFDDDDGTISLSFAVAAASVSAPTVTTAAASNVTGMSATVNGSVTDNGGEGASVCGFAWGTNSSLSGGDTATTTDSTCPATTGAFSKILYSLADNTTYYVRAYATNSGGTGYGSSIENFTTLVTRKIRLFGTIQFFGTIRLW